MNYRRNFEDEALGDEFELDLSEELYDEGELELFDTEMYETAARKIPRVPPIKQPRPSVPRPSVPRPRRKPRIPPLGFRQTIVTPFVTEPTLLPASFGAADDDFKPIAVESPGGGRIKDKGDPKPADVETVTGVGGKTVQLHRYAAAAWRALVKAARADGIVEPLLLIVSGYRSSARQKELWEAALKKYGSKEEARKWVAPPGGSAHQSGRAIDFHLGGKNSSANVANLRTLPAYKWLAANAERFGFYPYTAKPWHWEYNPPAQSSQPEFESFDTPELWNADEYEQSDTYAEFGDLELFDEETGYGWFGEAAKPKPAPAQTLAPLTAKEQAEFNRLTSKAQAQFKQLQTIINTYTSTGRKEADRASRILLLNGHFRLLSSLLPEIINLAQLTKLPSGWSASKTLPLLVGNVLYNLARPETINQGGWDRLGGKPDPTCFSACTQILLAQRYPTSYVRLVIQLATTSSAKFAGGDTIGPLKFVSTSLYKSLDSVLLQTAFDSYFQTKAMKGKYTPGDELKVHRQVFGSTRPPKYATYDKANRVAAFRKAFITKGGNTKPWESINLCVGNTTPACKGNHAVVLTRIANGRAYFYNPWANEEEKNMMWGTASVTVSGNGERPAESSMSQADFENQLTTVFHN